VAAASTRQISFTEEEKAQGIVDGFVEGIEFEGIPWF